MVAVDTNIVVRLITGDDPVLLEKATCLVETSGIWIGKTVALETAWVLQHLYKASIDEIRDSLRRLSETAGVCFETEDRLLLALDLTASNIEIADAFHLAFSDHSLPFYTFDRDFKQRARREGHNVHLAS